MSHEVCQNLFQKSTDVAADRQNASMMTEVDGDIFNEGLWQQFVITKGKERKSIYIAPFIYYVYLKAWITQFYLQIHHACLSFISVNQMAPPLTEVRDI